MNCEALFIEALRKSGVLLGVGDDAVLLQDSSHLPRIQSPKYKHFKDFLAKSLLEC